jgi:acyl-CoA dehydrogenase
LKLQLDTMTQEWQEKARRFAEEELIPCELEAEMNQGRLPPDVSKRHKEMAIELGFSSMDVPREHSGLDLRIVDQVAVWEQLGRVTNALCWCFSEPHEWMFQACSDDQLQRYVLPLMTGARKECYAITEADSGSDVVVRTTAERTAEGYRVNGEKWFVTSANLADFMFLQAKLLNGPHAGSDAMFFVDGNTFGIEEVRVPLFSHTFNHHHPEMRFKNV